MSSGWHRQRRQRLVGAGVERAHDQRPSVERLSDLPQRGGLLVLAGQLVAAQEQELRAQQADALGAELHRAARVAAGAEVGEHLDPLAVSRHRGLVGALPRRRAPPLAAFAALLGVAHHVRRRVDDHRPRLAVEQERGPVGDPEHPGPQADHRGQPERTGQDGGVRGRGAARRGDGQHPLGVQGGGVGGGQLVGDDDPRCLPATLRTRPGDGVHDAAADIEHVGRPLLEQWLVKSAVDRGHLLRGVMEGALGGGAGGDGGASGLEQGLVDEQGEMGIEDRGIGGAGPAHDGTGDRARWRCAPRRSPRPACGSPPRGRAPHDRAAPRPGRRGGARGRWRRRWRRRRR